MKNKNNSVIVSRDVDIAIAEALGWRFALYYEKRHHWSYNGCRVEVWSWFPPWGLQPEDISCEDGSIIIKDSPYTPEETRKLAHGIPSFSAFLDQEMKHGKVQLPTQRPAEPRPVRGVGSGVCLGLRFSPLEK